ncbi:hypothetical protein LOZ67_001529 [Ophidiomyces ophidiicola]|nr:hypothetical protein LOZ67_001529 [Ophidiomyces ophidiicola]
MVASLRRVLDSLLEEISLCGDRGASPTEVLGFIEAIYATSTLADDHIGRPCALKVDRPLKAKLWTWLTQNPEVSVGRNREGNGLSLEEALGAEAHAGQVISPSEPEESEVLLPDPRRETTEVPRVFVSQERMWHSITGHEPDKSRVLPLEFDLLSIISTHKSRGIVQGDLVRLSGQDKRSVPKRTDLLQLKGYIEKKAIQYKGARTSLCVLKRFASATREEISQTVRFENERVGDSQANDLVDFSVLLDKLFQCLRERKVITRSELKEKLGMTELWRSKILRRAIIKLEAIGCLRRVKAISQYHQVMKSLHPSIMLIRDPTEKDIRLFHEDNQAVIASLRQGDTNSLRDSQGQDEDLEDIDDMPGAASLGPVTVVQDASRVVPQWTPDQNLSKFVLDIIHKAGPAGMNNLEIVAASMGPFFRRPIEALVSRLVNSWQFAQPLHIRYLSLVRDTALRGTISYFVHYSYETFAALVENGQASWEAVSGSGKKDGSRFRPIDAKPVFDEYGFPPGNEPPNILNHGSSSLWECLNIAKPTDYVATHRDPMVVHLPDGTLGIRLLDQVRNQKNWTNGRRNARHKIKRSASDAGLTDFKLISDIPAKGLTPDKRRKKIDDVRPMTELERLEAKGYDQSWTAYSVLMLERPTPGLYMTAIGKRRAHGMRQGRAGRSRIAIFKFSRLHDFDWFVAEEEIQQATNLSTMLDVAEVQPHLDTQSTLGHMPQTRSQRRKGLPTLVEDLSKTRISEGVENSVKDARVESADGRSVSIERISKKRKFPTSVDVASDHLIAKAKSPTKRRKGRPFTADLVDISQGNLNSTDEPTTSPMKPGQEREEEQAHPSSNRLEVSSEELANTIEAEPSITEVQGRNKKHKLGITPMESTPIKLVNEGRGQPAHRMSAGEPATPAPSTGAQRESALGANRENRGGSIALLRRKIVMDIIQQCDGIHPMGTELWYPFATAWLKTRPEKPDMRTIRSAVKSLIESGKLRQLTFSGKNSKGLMVTKNLLTKPEIDSMDPMVRSIQEAMLDADPRFYLHPKAHIDPSLKKSHKGLTSQEIKLPELNEEVRVTLNYIPARMRPKPTRIPRYRFISFGTGSRDFDTMGPRALQRLKSLHKRASASPFLDSLSTPIPQSSSEIPMLLTWPPRNIYADLLFGAKWKPSLLSMLMFPAQTFNCVTGTFGTGVCYASKRKRRPPLRKLAPLLPASAPQRLDDILSIAKKQDIDFSTEPDPVATEFFSNIDAVRDWELKTYPYTPPRTPALRYIDHTISGPFESVPLEGPVRFETDPHSASPVRGRRSGPPVTRQATRAMTESPFDETWPFFRYFVPRKTARDSRFGQTQPRTETQANRRLAQLQESVRTSAGASKSMDRTLKRVRLSKDFPQHVAQKLTMTIVVVRALAGGFEGKLIDWPLVASVFPGYDPKFIQDRGKSILSRHRLQIAKMQRDFQERYLEAYEKNLVPKIDYDDLEGYDWGAVVEWAEEQLDRPSLMRVPSLPATREQFESIFGIRKEPIHGIDDIYHHGSHITVSRKRVFYANLPFTKLITAKTACTVATLDKVKKAEAVDRLETAKSWVRSNVVTPEETYRATDARQTLERFGEHLIGEAIQSLITERVISMGNRGKVRPGRNYDVTEYFLVAFGRKRMLESVQLRRALQFKLEVLDPAMRSDGKYQVPYEAEDGDILVLINLAAQGRVTVWPVNPPRNKYGLTDMGYLTRTMDKKKLHFDMEIHLVTGKYVYGNPLADVVSTTPAPDAGLREDGLNPMVPLPKIPLWIDVHGKFVKLLWELVVASVVGLIAARPGSGLSTILRIMQPFLGAWEGELVLRWLNDVGAIRKTEQDSVEEGWVVEEWWYLILCMDLTASTASIQSESRSFSEQPDASFSKETPLEL